MTDEQLTFLVDALKKYVISGSKESLDAEISRGITEDAVMHDIKRFYLDNFSNTDIRNRPEDRQIIDLLKDINPDSCKMFLTETALKEDDPDFPVSMMTNDGYGIKFSDDLKSYSYDSLGESTSLSKQQAETLINSKSIVDKMGNLLDESNVKLVDPLFFRAKVVNKMIGFEPDESDKFFIDKSIERGNDAFNDLFPETAKTYLFQVSVYDGVTGQSWLYKAENAQQVMNFLNDRKVKMDGKQILGIHLASGDDVRPNRSITDVSTGRTNYISADEMRKIIDIQKDIPDVERGKILLFEEKDIISHESENNIANKGEKEMEEEKGTLVAGYEFSYGGGTDKVDFYQNKDGSFDKKYRSDNGEYTRSESVSKDDILTEMSIVYEKIANGHDAYKITNEFQDTDKGEKTMSESEVKDAEVKDVEKPEVETVTLKFGKGYVGEPFTGKDDVSYVDIKIPNVDAADKSPWKQFVVPAKSVHEDKFSENLSYIKIPSHSSVTLSQSVINEDGTFTQNTEKIAAADLKEKLDAVIDKNKDFNKDQDIEMTTVKFGRGFVGEPFTAKNGKNYVDIKIPNADREDKSPWKQFVLPEKAVHEDQFHEKLSWAKIPAHSSVTLSQSVKETDGSFTRNTEKITAADLKEKLDAVLPKDKVQEKSKLAEVKALGNSTEKTADAPQKEQER